uniref:Chondroitin proteoglycan 4 domain-containing protein n=1 Tax=Panagrellus redivivus TaxID=6233 RepID=A0A7E4V3N0_PANRE
MRFALVCCAVAACLLNLATAQMIRQCSCAEVGPCKNQYANSVIPCADQCQKHAASVGANYPQLRACLVSHEAQFRAAMTCMEQKHSQSCSNGGGGMVQKRYPETLKIAAMSEIDSMLNKLGIAGQVKGLMATGKKLFSCMRKCVDAKAGGCGKKLGCGLQLPADSVLVQQAKQCAIQAGFNTPTLQSICKCAAASGISQLNAICPRIQIV